MELAIVARDLSKCFRLRHNRANELKVRFLGLFHRDKRETIEEFWALRDVSFSIERGESVGIVGRNGSGKSTLLRLVAGLHRPTSGRLFVAENTRIGTLIELGIGFHLELTGRENVFLNASIHGLAHAKIDAIYPAIVEYSGLGHFMDVPLKNYSSGMHVRLGFAVVANLDVDMMLLDELLAVGDADFQGQCIKSVKEFRDRGKTILFVSHAPEAVRAICKRLLVLDHGRLVYDGGVDEGLDFYARMGANPPTPIGPMATASAGS